MPLNFAIVILSYNQPETTIDLIKSIQAVKPREFSDKQIFVVHNGTDEPVVSEMRKRYPRFYHVVLQENEGFAAGANAGISAAFALYPWVLFLTQDTTLVHFPKSPPFEPSMATVKIYKRNTDAINSFGGAVDLELAKNYLCPKPDLFWNAFESRMLSPYIPRTAFWIHQQPFEKLGGFDEVIGTMWEDVDFSLRMRREGEMLGLDETTEVIHHRKGLCRREPLYTHYFYNRNRFYVARAAPRSPAAKIKFELGLVIEWLLLYLNAFMGPNRNLVLWSYLDSQKFPMPNRFGVGMGGETPDETPPAPAAAGPDSGIVTASSPGERETATPKAPATTVPKTKSTPKAAAPPAPKAAETRTVKTATTTEADTAKNTVSAAGLRTMVVPTAKKAAPAAQAAAAPTSEKTVEKTIQTESKFTPDDRIGDDGEEE